MPYKNSEKTKAELSDALKSLLKTKRLSKISIKDITDKCKMNRNSFYYHFEDINGLLKWTLDRESLIIANTVDPTNFKKTLQDTIAYVKNNKFILNCVFDSFGREQLKTFFYPSVRKAIETMVNYQNNTNDKYKAFVRDRLIEMAGSTLLEYFRNEEKEFDADEIIDYLTRLIEANAKIVNEQY